MDTLPIELISPISEINKTYPYQSSTTFYALANPTYYQYYNRTVKWWGYWYDGWVPGFHDQTTGVISTGICNAIVNNISDLISGQKLLFTKKTKETSDSDIDFIHKWSYESDFQVAYKNMIKYSGGLGTSLIKLNISQGDIWTETLRFDYFYFQADARNRVIELVALIKPYVNAMPNNVGNYYLVEKRYFETEILEETISGIKCKVEKRYPTVIYQVIKYNGQSEQKSFSLHQGSTLSWKNVPYEIQKQIKEDYGFLEISVPKRLPFVNLGAYLFKYEEDGTRPQSPFGKSISSNLLGWYMQYDKATSWMYRDQFLGKGTLIVPKSMEMNTQGYGYQQGVPDQNFSYIESIDPEKQKPINVQFNLRVAEWERQLDNIMKRIATNIGVNVSSLAAHIRSDGMKTATEIDADVDMTLAYIEDHRQYIAPQIDRILEDVLNFYKRSGNVKCKFSTPSIVNIDKLVKRVATELEYGLISKPEALKIVNPDLDERQIDKLHYEAEKEYQKRRKEDMEVAGRSLDKVDNQPVDKKKLVDSPDNQPNSKI